MGNRSVTYSPSVFTNINLCILLFARIRYERASNERMMSITEKLDVILDFEVKCQGMRHRHCKCCQTVRIAMDVSVTKSFCENCAKKQNDDFYLENKALPVWYKEGLPQYQLPMELQELSHAEKMLIQRISPFVPLYHIKWGTFGLSGHVCAFEQDIEGFCARLPRDRSDVSMMKVMQSVRAEIGSMNKQAAIKAFRVRKDKVFAALRFLKEYNPLYSDIVIDLDALDWIDGAEGVLDGAEVKVDDFVTSADNTAETADMGPAPDQAMHPAQTGDNVSCFGFLHEGGMGELSADDTTANDVLRNAVSQSPNRKDIVVDWPDIGDIPVSEYSDKKIFALAFPWLFPGGLGDVKDHPGSITTWGKHMLFYQDGRFARDKIFCFFALNYIVRRRNNSAGKFFVDDFQRNCPDTLEELKDAILQGETSFVNSLTYFNKRITGSTPFWLGKKSEVYTWINHHVQAGHGAPMFFITLSCAEYYWADIVDLLRHRMALADIDYSHCYVGSPKMPEIVNDYAVVIQEYFQLRVVTWLQTVGKQIFGIDHYWVRYEFAPGRGQIHAHLLAISNDTSVYERCHMVRNDVGGKEERAKIMSGWARQKFGLTASVGDGFDDRNITESNSPIKIRMKDLSLTGNPHPTTNQHYEDGQNLLKNVMVHQCSQFCLQTRAKTG